MVRRSPMCVMVRVKICGIRRYEDARLAIDAGADALGFLVGQNHPSPDFLEVEQARAIVSVLPPFITSVLVTHVEDEKNVIELIHALGVSSVQIHSGMSPDGVSEVRHSCKWIKIIKSLHVVNEKSIGLLGLYEGRVDAFLLDSINVNSGQVGGTGQTHDWGISRDIVRHARRPVILAGGLNPANVAEAIRLVAPFGVDVNSGTKGPGGFKDPEKVRAFVSVARRVNSPEVFPT
jgi:phosphoribosylanthranilate isomerase